MANLIIKSSADDLVLKGSGGNSAITVGSTGNTTLAGTANNLGTVTAGTIGTGVTFPSGHILNTVQTVKTGVVSEVESTAAIDWSDITGMTCNITPASGNKVLVFYTANIGSRVGYMMSLRLMRGSTAIYIGDEVSGNPRASSRVRGEDVNMWNANGMYLDASAGGDGSTAITYKLQWTGESSNTMYLNRSYAHNAGSYYYGMTASHITLMEVKA